MQVDLGNAVIRTTKPRNVGRYGPVCIVNRHRQTHRSNRIGARLLSQMTGEGLFSRLIVRIAPYGTRFRDALVALMYTNHLLQQHPIGRGTAHRFSQFRKDETPIEGGKTLVGVDRQNAASVACPLGSLVTFTPLNRGLLTYATDGGVAAPLG